MDKISQNTNNDILDCKDLYVVLSNTNGHFEYIESYHLTNILYSNQKYWGKFSNVHAACGHPDLYQNQVLSYAYNNFSNVVCTSGLVSRTKRFLSAKSYATMDFNTRSCYESIWSLEDGGELEMLLEAVRKGLKLKLKIESIDDYVYILNLHTVEVDICAGQFFAESEYDGYPEEIRQFSQIHDIEKLFVKAEKERGIRSPSTNYYQNSEYFLTSFKVYNDHILHRYLDDEGNIRERAYIPKAASIWQECIA